jgi:dTDP-4-dehydrorhamnose 3,5-epimerase
VGYIEGLIFTPLQIVNTLSGDVLHAMKCTDDGYTGFGEAYFSIVECDLIKAWKRHREMTLNLIVPVGIIRFVIYDERQKSSTYGVFQEIVLSKENYGRLTVPPLVWVGFQGMGKGVNMLLNIANMPHNPSETDRKELKDFNYEWSLKT